MSKRRTVFIAGAAVVLLTISSYGFVSADEGTPPPSTTMTTVVEHYEEESGIFWSQVDNHTIEISLPD